MLGKEKRETQPVHGRTHIPRPPSSYGGLWKRDHASFFFWKSTPTQLPTQCMEIVENVKCEKWKL